MLLVDSIGDNADPLAVIIRFPIPLFWSHEGTLIAGILVPCMKRGTDNPPHIAFAGSRCQANKRGLNVEEKTPFVVFVPAAGVSEELLLNPAHKVTRTQTGSFGQNAGAALSRW
jgi:hypothetical protein